jgi:hypothetical protein
VLVVEEEFLGLVLGFAFVLCGDYIPSLYIVHKTSSLNVVDLSRQDGKLLSRQLSLLKTRCAWSWESLQNWGLLSILCEAPIPFLYRLNLCVELVFDCWSVKL